MHSHIALRFPDNIFGLFALHRDSLAPRFDEGFLKFAHPGQPVITGGRSSSEPGRSVMYLVVDAR